jgi:hypothetical protein
MSKTTGPEPLAEAVTKRSYPQVRTTFIRNAAPYLDALRDIDEMVEDVRTRLTSRPPPYLVLETELEGQPSEKTRTKPEGSV